MAPLAVCVRALCVRVCAVGCEKEQAPGTFEPTLGDVLIHFALQLADGSWHICEVSAAGGTLPLVLGPHERVAGWVGQVG